MVQEGSIKGPLERPYSREKDSKLSMLDKPLIVKFQKEITFHSLASSLAL